MREVVVAAFAEDLVLEFSSVLRRDAPVLCVLPCVSGGALTYAVRPGEDIVSQVGSLVSRCDRPAGAGDGASDDDGGGDGDGDAASLGFAPDDRVWTHSPCDPRPARARAARWAVEHGELRRIWFAARGNDEFGFLHDVAAPLEPSALADKLRLVADHLPDLLHETGHERSLTAAAASSIESFVALDRHEALRMTALARSLAAPPSAIADPWQFHVSSFERDRIDRTVAWVARETTGRDGPLLEVGSCEGAMTVALLDRGLPVVASEPDERFRARLSKAVGARARVLGVAAEQLADAPDVPPGGVWLFAELLYYFDDFSFLDRCPVETLLITASPAFVRDRVLPWIAASSVWTVCRQADLVAPRLEWLLPGKVFQRKIGSSGVVCWRRS